MLSGDVSSDGDSSSASMTTWRTGRSSYFIVFLHACVALLAGASDAHVGGRVFYAWEIATADLPDLYDRTLEDWEEVVPAVTLTNDDLSGASNWSSAQQSSEDLVMRMFMAWHDESQQIYLSFEIIDDLATRGDLLTIHVDADHSGGRYEILSLDASDLETTTGAQYDHVQVTRDDGDDAWTWRGAGPTAWAYAQPWKEAFRSSDGEAPARTTIEMKITPWDALGPDADQSSRSRLHAGQSIGFQLSFTDFDLAPEGVWVIGGVDTATRNGILANAETFADVELVGCDYLDCSQGGTVVAPNSWGRIKASLK